MLEFHRLLAGIFLSLTLIITSSIGQLHSFNDDIQIDKQWNVIRYNLPWGFPQKFNIPENIVVTGIAVDYDRIFVATPRLLSGVPATLSTVSRKSIGDSPVLEAYPDWSFHEAGQKKYNCSDLGLVSVYRLRIDSCNRIWALDAGVSRSLEDFEVTCPPKILIFDGKTNQVVRRIDFPKEVIRGETLYTNMIIDETTSRPENHCDDAFVYISDTVEPAIVVYDSGNDLTWRLSHPSMYPDPNFAQSEILGERFTLMDGIVGLAFDDKAQVVYFQPLATDRLFSITTDALRAGPLKFNEELPVKLVGKKSSQGIGLAVSQYDGSIFFSPFSETAVAKWNPHTNDQQILAQDPDQLQFVADIRVPPNEPESLYILSSRFHRYFLKNLDTHDINVRILRINIHPQAKQSFKTFYNDQPKDYDSLGDYHQNYHRYQTTKPSTNIFPFNILPATTSTITKQPHLYSHHNTYYDSTVESPHPTSDTYNNKNINPYTALNIGETPHHHSNQYYANIGTGSPAQSHNYQYSKINHHFNDFNGLRNVKSVSYNTTVIH